MPLFARAVLSIALLALPLAAQSGGPVVSRISPSSGPKHSRFHITIHGSGLTICNPGCHRPEVTVGGVTATVDRYEPGFLDLTIEPASPGKKTIVIRRSDGVELRLIEAFTVTDSTETSTRESVLLPIATPPVEGAFGSRWVTEMFARNAGDHDVELTDEFSNAIGIPPPEPAIRARSTADISSITEFTRGTSHPGYVLKIDRRYVDDIHFSLHSKDLSRSATNAGTEIQVVRERELATGTIVFPLIPVTSGFRLLLRVYDPFPRDGRRVRVRMFGPDSSQPFGDRTLTFTHSVRLLAGPPHPAHPGYAEFDPRQILDEPSIMPLGVRIQLDPVGEPFPYWAFVSITNNETQHVTTVTPQ